MEENVCYICGVSFNMKRKLDVHIRLHTGEHPFECQEEVCTIHYGRKLLILKLPSSSMAAHFERLRINL